MLIGTIFFIIFFVIISLQIYFSLLTRKYHKKIIPGLILPIITFLFSICFCIWFAIYGTIGNIYSVTLTNGSHYNFESVEKANEFIATIDNKGIASFNHINDEKSTATPIIFFSNIFRLFLGINVFTSILLIIFWCFKKYRNIHLNI